MKICSICKQEKPLTAFSKRASRKSGYRSECKVCQSQNMKQYFVKNRKRILNRNKQYKKRTKYPTYYTKRRYHSDIQFRLCQVLRARLRSAIKTSQKIGSAIKNLGCSVPKLIEHLESQFQSNMSWGNYGSGWEIDHIKPLSLFDLTNRKEIEQACHYTNLQPLWKLDNIRKGNKS